MIDGGLGYLVAFGAGVVSFVSPCVLPIVPGYLSVVCSVSFADLNNGTSEVRRRIFRETSLFVGGFALVFIALGLSASLLGSVLFRNQLLFIRISGALLILMALFLIGVHFLRVPWLMGEVRLRPKTARFGPLAAPVAGIAFGFGWTPCIGPVLASVLTVAASSTSPWRGGSLLAVYSLGMGVPFLITGLASAQASKVFKWVRRHYAAINIVSAGLLLVFGILLATNNITLVTIKIQEVMRALGLGRLVNLG